MNALEIYEIQEVEQLEGKEQFKVTNIDQANWCLRKISALKKKQIENEQLAKAEIERIEKWLKKENEQLENSIKFFEVLLEEYAKEQREKDAKFKLSTPYGKLSFRKQQPKWNYDEETVLKFLKASGKTEFIRVKEEINKAELKKKFKVVGELVVDENGEIIEGITIEEQPEKVVIDVEVE
ncbi:host-nuclease inhibitor Gam family protein [Caloramator sp. ALD01]|uniref:host-nuclease inhibitor Gam family protein n=1 Tax=Caloramator sp. ALD01 TaxID=1031288 RepID=UPI000400D43D|nr:host-nuclease inhibitor Gam family protein [Caloramator sp. ALD01]